MKWLRALGSLTILVGVLVGVPWLLLALGSPLTLLEVDWVSALGRPDDGRILLGLLSVIGWIAWLLLVVTVVAECVAVLSNRTIDIRVPGTGWLRPVIGSLVAAATFAPGALAIAAPLPDAHVVAHTIAPSSPPGVPEPSTQTGRQYVIQPGDELWSVAESQLGSGERWRHLLTVNPGMGAASRLTPGQPLQLPPDVEVVRGDSLWSLAERHLGDPSRWPEIHALNSDLVTDPDHLAVGWRLLLPAESPPNAPLGTASVPVDAPDEVVEETGDVGAVDAREGSGQHGAIIGSPPSRTAVHPPGTPARETQTAPNPSPTQSAGPRETHTAASVTPAEDDAAARVLGPIGGLLASTIIVGVAARRRLQLVGRAVGRRLIPVAPDTGRFWTALARVADGDQQPTEPTPTTVVLGFRDDGTHVTHHLEAARCTTVSPVADAQSVVAAMVTSLACAPWSCEVEIVVVGADQPWADALDDPRITAIADADDGISHYTKLSARRRLALGTALLEEARTNPDTAPAYAPTVHLFATALSPKQRAKLDEALSFGSVGTSLVLVGEGGSHIESDGEHAHLDGDRFRPQLIEAPARRALIDLFTLTGAAETEPAPWFTGTTSTGARHADTSGAAPTMDSPYLVLLGEPDLLDPRGTAPSRARQQCVEYCAWMALHPGSRSSTMQHALVIAEGTRRSNLSRLRKWLGADDDGVEYLPDAYDGRLHLDPRITTDWHMLQRLLAGGVDVAPGHALRQALAMVQGPPLGTAILRWAWARSLHDDMVSVVVDAACVLADRCLEEGRVEEALWALDRAELAAPGHDEVAIRRVAAHADVGDGAAAQAAVTRFLSDVATDGREVSAEQSATLARAQRATHQQREPAARASS